MDKLKAIGTFINIVRYKSLSEAARSLGITRGLASVHLKQLEDDLGVRLVNRTTRHLSLTGQGEDYYEFCCQITRMFAEKDAEVAQWQDSPTGHLKVLASSALAEFVLAPIVARFAAKYEELHVSLLTATSQKFSHELVELGFDIGITMHPVEEVSMIVTRLGDITWHPYAAPSYLEKHGTPTTPAELSEHICLPHKSISPDWTWRFRLGEQTEEVKVRGPLFTNNVMILREFVLSGLGIGLLPDYSVPSGLADGEIVQVLREYSVASREVFAVYPSARHLPMRNRVFLDFLRTNLRISLNALHKSLSS